MKIIGITGWKNSGKTTLVARLVAELCARGLRISTVKHAHHNCDIDQPGRDSFQHREAGAHQVLLASSKRWALMQELRDEPEPELDALLPQLAPVDLVVVEGFKLAGHPKIQVIRSANNRAPLPEQAQNLVAIATDDPQLAPADYGCSGPRLPIDDIGQIADFVQAFTGAEPSRCAPSGALPHD
ncbi:molybdopterin-guanine dinucleotide biosynthesis protein B [Simiduia sp. 21SJ11W-1]|uniref:molybdopterin-guanine dinucleotide biosynthesis protein B n=1 Tax=Simiduia sp. 21SJ11W-1 TaxID=2909669 RepID=UPI00209E5CAB|nr:molybdopterin-guanine dinucleotide biosynthesis protein B [Simiduia sp. 21SJ11W-1]UTA48922.1 molybdopterin-guanine dinucleotide biosynthesis protein B [Simiduia sp. 21SJ11W-1]